MSLSMEHQLLSYFGADIASKYSDFKVESSKDISLDASQLNKLALRTSNPIRFLSACKDNQVLSDSKISNILAALYSDLVGDSIKSSSVAERYHDNGNRNNRHFKVNGRCPLRDADKSTCMQAIYLDLLGFVMGSFIGTVVGVEFENDNHILVIPEEYSTFPRLVDWASLLSTVWGLQIHIDSLYGKWEIRSQSSISQYAEVLAKMKLEAYSLYQELSCGRASQSDCWKFLDEFISLCQEGRESNCPNNDLKMIVESCEESPWNSADMFNQMSNKSDDLKPVIEISKKYRMTRSVASSCGLSFSKYQVFRPLGNIYSVPSYSLKTAQSRFKEQIDMIKCRLIASRSDIVSKLKDIFKVFLLQETTFLDEVFKSGGSLLSKECTESSFTRFMSQIKSLDSDSRHLSFFLDDYGMEDRLRAINTGIFPAEVKSLILLEKISLQINDELIELLLSSENVFKLQILFRFYMNLYFILGCFEELVVDSRTPNNLKIPLFEITTFIRQFLVVIKPFSDPFSGTPDETRLVSEILVATDGLHQSFKRALLSNSKCCDTFGQLIALSIEFLFHKSEEKLLISLKECIANLLTQWKALSSRGDIYADSLLQNLDQKHFETVKATGLHKY